MNVIDQVEIIIIGATIGLSILLSILSASAYKRTKLKKMVYATIAYSLFAVFSINQFYEEYVLEGGNGAHPSLLSDIALHAVPLAILVLLFVGIVKKENYNH
jgi:hypothetical protein